MSMRPDLKIISTMPPQINRRETDDLTGLLQSTVLGSRIVAVTDDRAVAGWLVFHLESGTQIQIQTFDRVYVIDPTIH